ncbi:MAG: amidohydrolase family protein [Acidimicrobiales bacterium]
MVVGGDRVAWLGPLSQLPERFASVGLVDQRRGVITPGLVNAHTHLQYSRFSDLGRKSYESFEQWAYAFEVVFDAVTDPPFWTESALEGTRQAIAGGTTVFAETITNVEARGAIASCGVTGIEYLEEIGQTEVTWKQARARFLACLDQPNATPTGISPHALYSLDPSVIRDLLSIAAERGLRIHSHVAESAMEADLYRTGDPAVVEIYSDHRKLELVRRGGTGLETAQYADSLGLLSPTTHLAHGVYLDRAGRDLLLERGTQVALCPRSNAALGVGPAPVAAYLSEGHEIAVGTDSLASSPSLDLLADVALLADIAAEQGYTGSDLAARLLRAATVGGAKALGLYAGGYGTLSPGGPADLAVFDVDVTDNGVEAALVAEGEGRCTLTVAGGRVVHDAAGLATTLPAPHRSS